MNSYTVTTDGFQYETDAESVDEAIAEAFSGEGLGPIVDEESLSRLFGPLTQDGGWCWIEEDDVRVVELACRSKLLGSWPDWISD